MVKVSYRGISRIKGSNVKVSWTPAMLAEYKKCMNNPKYFIREYMKVINLDKGLTDFDLYPYQEKMIDQFQDNRFNIVLACRQSGKSISVIAYILWYAIFNADKTIAILANKGETARELLSRLVIALENIPFFLQPGAKEVNKSSLTFENNTKIVARATTPGSARGISANLILLDEFAFVEQAESFYASTYPTITSGKESKVIITSTANGVGNPFQKIWRASIQGTNEFIPFRVDWWDVPGRDEAWKKQTISNTSELQFEQEFGNSFIGTGKTLISAEALLGLRSRPPEYVTDDGVKIYQEAQEGRVYAVGVDVAEGRVQDYSAFNIIDITDLPYLQVASFQDNIISPLLFGTVINKYAIAYNNAVVIVENNNVGALVCYDLHYNLEYENLYVSKGLKFEDVGVRMDKKTKRIGCSTFKDLVEASRLEIHDVQTIEEMGTFEAKGVSFEATEGNHDDLVMSFVVFAWFTCTTDFLEYTDKNIKDMLYQERMQEIEDDVLPFGFIEDGQPEEKIVDSSGQVWEVYDNQMPM